MRIAQSGAPTGSWTKRLHAASEIGRCVAGDLKSTVWGPYACGYPGLASSPGASSPGGLNTGPLLGSGPVSFVCDGVICAVSAPRSVRQCLIDRRLAARGNIARGNVNRAVGRCHEGAFLLLDVEGVQLAHQNLFPRHAPRPLDGDLDGRRSPLRSEEHTSELQ